MSNCFFESDSNLTGGNLDSPLESTGEALQNMVSEAYQFADHTKEEIEKSSKPVSDYIQKRAQENPQELFLEGVGAAACLGLGAAAIANPGSWVVGGLVYGSMLSGGSVVTYETFKQLKEHRFL